MSKHRTKIVVSIATILLIAAGLLAFTPVSSVSGSPSPGGRLVIGDDFGPGPQNMATLEDEDGITYRVRLIAEESGIGEGSVAMQLDEDPDGPLELCTAHNGGVFVDFASGGNGGGDYPLTNIQCGTAYGMAVAIDGCQADIEFHGYVHSDYPFVNYMGMMTADVKFKGDDNEIEITIFTPKEEIELKGTVEGDVVMATCGG